MICDCCKRDAPIVYEDDLTNRLGILLQRSIPLAAYAQDDVEAVCAIARQWHGEACATVKEWLAMRDAPVVYADDYTWSVANEKEIEAANNPEDLAKGRFCVPIKGTPRR